MKVLYKLGATLLALLALAGGIRYTMHLRTELVQAKEAAQEAQDALRRTQRTLALREKSRAATGREMASLRASLAEAQVKNKAWSEAPVPKEVQDALCARIRCPSPSGLRELPETGNHP